MEKIVMIIEKSRNHYGAYAENGDGIYAAGNTIEEVQADTEQAIELIKNELPQDQWPSALRGEYELVWKFDSDGTWTEDSLSIEGITMQMSVSGDILTLTGLQRITGINSKQLSHYATGYRKPSPKTVSRIQDGITRFAEMLKHVSLA